MKRAAVPLILFLFGFVLGILCLFPMVGREPAAAAVLSPVQGSSEVESEETPEFSSQDTAALLRSAAAVAQALKHGNYDVLARYVDPNGGSLLPPTPR